MSEKPSTNAGRIDAWDTNRQAHERKQWEDALYDGAGETDFSDEARTRAEEAQKYEDYMAGFVDRSEGHDTIDEDRLDAIDRTIQGDARLRQMVNLAKAIRSIAEHKLDGTEDADRLAQRFRDKEDKLQERLEKYMENGQASEHEKDEIMNRIIGMTRGEVSEDAPQETQSSIDPAPENDSAESVDEAGVSSLEGEADNSESAQDNPEGDLQDASSDEAEAGSVEDLPTIGMTDEEISLKRRNMIKSGMRPLDVGNMNNDMIVAYNLVETEAATELGATGEDDAGDSGEANLDDDGERVDTSLDDDDTERVDTSLEDDSGDRVDTSLEDYNEINSGGWARRHWSNLRENGIGAYLGGHVRGARHWAEGRRNPNFEQTRGSRRAWALGIAAVTAVAAGWAYYKMKNGMQPTTPYTPSIGPNGAPLGPSDSIDISSLPTGTGGEASTTPGGNEVPAPAPAAPEVDDIDSYRYPWNWAADVFGREDATPKLRDLVEAARADGIDIKWNGLGDGNDKNNWISINGNSDSKFVIETLDQYR